MSYFITYDDYYEKALGNIINLIIKQDKLKMSQMKIKNLIFKEGGNGVYLFFDNDDCIYIGSSCGRAFVDRIPAHFDTRKEIGRWGFRGVCTGIVKENNCTRFEAASKLLNCGLYLINFKNNEYKQTYCSKLEKLLIYLLQPKYNIYYKKNIYETNPNESLVNNLKKIR
ncbi:MAG: hypothetical protein WAK96_14295 [Desulfobaccales bacterium]